jgi:hypothetical protein
MGILLGCGRDIGCLKRGGKASLEGEPDASDGQHVEDEAHIRAVESPLKDIPRRYMPLHFTPLYASRHRIR